MALLVHGEEALLAVGFIFTIHFFNGHFRPEKFPIDTVIFTGSLPEAEWREERPGEYELGCSGRAASTSSWCRRRHQRWPATARSSAGWR